MDITSKYNSKPLGVTTNMWRLARIVCVLAFFIFVCRCHKTVNFVKLYYIVVFFYCIFRFYTR